MDPISSLAELNLLSTEEIVAILNGQLQCFNTMVGQHYCTGKTVAQIGCNPNQQNRKAIYDLLLSDHSQIILKLCLKNFASYERELKGLEFANGAGIPGPLLICHGRYFSPSLPVPYFLMTRVERKPLATFFAGQIAADDFERELDSNPELWEFLFRKILDAVRILHQPSITNENYYYHPKMIQRLWRWYEQKITVFPVQSGLLAGQLKKLFRYYEDHRPIFGQAPYYHVHGDLDPSNLCFTEAGVVLLDWENFHQGDCTEDIAYLLERFPGNLALKTDYLRIITQLYSKQDPHFTSRLGFQTALTKLWHVLEKGKPVADFVQFVNNHLELQTGQGSMQQFGK